MTDPRPLPAHLQRLGQQLEHAASQRRRNTLRARVARRYLRSLLALPLAGGVAVGVLLIATATTKTTPAYALTRHADGSITITLNQLTRGIPALNARLRQLGIDETVIPIKPGCRPSDGSRPLVMHPNPMQEFDGSISTTYTPRAAQRHPAAPGFHYLLAAKRLSNGKILGFIGALRAPLPNCLGFNPKPSALPS
jgi:hypothetical protein